MNAALSNKTLSILNEDKHLFTYPQALTTGLKVPGSDLLTWMNKTELHWTVSGVPHSNYSYTQLSLNGSIQHFKKRKTVWELYWGVWTRKSFK